MFIRQNWRTLSVGRDNYEFLLKTVLHVFDHPILPLTKKLVRAFSGLRGPPSGSYKVPRNGYFLRIHLFLEGLASRVFSIAQPHRHSWDTLCNKKQHNRVEKQRRGGATAAGAPLFSIPAAANHRARPPRPFLPLSFLDLARGQQWTQNAAGYIIFCRVGQSQHVKVASITAT